MEAVLCGRNSNERRRGEGSEDWKTEVQGGLREETGFQSGSIASTLLPTRLDLGEVPESPVAEPGSLGVFAASLIVYRTQAKPLKLNRGSARLYIQTPINRAVLPARPRLAPQFPFKARGVSAGKASPPGEGAESCRAVSPWPGDGLVTSLPDPAWPSGSPRAEGPALTQNRQPGKPEGPAGRSRRVCEGGGRSRPARRPWLSSPKPRAIN